MQLLLNGVEGESMTNLFDMNWLNKGTMFIDFQYENLQILSCSKTLPVLFLMQV